MSLDYMECVLWDVEVVRDSLQVRTRYEWFLIRKKVRSANRDDRFALNVELFQYALIGIKFPALKVSSVIGTF